MASAHTFKRASTLTYRLQRPGVGLGPDGERGLLLAAELRAHTNAIGATLSYRIGK